MVEKTSKSHQSNGKRVSTKSLPPSDTCFVSMKGLEIGKVNDSPALPKNEQENLLLASAKKNEMEQKKNPTAVWENLIGIWKIFHNSCFQEFYSTIYNFL